MEWTGNNITWKKNIATKFETTGIVLKQRLSLLETDDPYRQDNYKISGYFIKNTNTTKLL